MWHGHTLGTVRCDQFGLRNSRLGMGGEGPEDVWTFGKVAGLSPENSLFDKDMAEVMFTSIFIPSLFCIIIPFLRLLKLGTTDGVDSNHKNILPQSSDAGSPKCRCSQSQASSKTSTGRFHATS